MKPITQKRFAVLLTLLLLVSLCIPMFTVPTSAATVDLLSVMDSHAYKDEAIAKKVTLPYRIYLPDSLAASFPAGADNASKKDTDETNTEPIAPPEGNEYGLLIWLHDEDGRGDDNVSHISNDAKNGLINALLNNADRAADTVVIAPQCPKGETWLDNKGQLLNILDSLLNNYILKLNIDRDRIMIGGISMGADAGYDILSRQGEDGVLPLSAAYLIAGETKDEIKKEDDATPYKNTAVYAFLSENDTIQPPESVKALGDALVGYGCSFTYSLYPELGHEVWHQAFVEGSLLEAFLSTNAPKAESIETEPPETETAEPQDTEDTVETAEVPDTKETEPVTDVPPMTVAGMEITGAFIAYIILGAACILSVVMLITGVMKNNKVR